MANLTWQHILGLLVLAIPIACIARTVVFEEVFREPREWCENKSRTCQKLLHKKFFYLFTCEYCFSHWVTLLFLAVTRFQLMYDDWKGYVIAFFSLVFVANSYLNLYARLRIDITSEKKAIEATEMQIESTQRDLETKERELQKLDVELAERQPASIAGSQRSDGTYDGH